MWKRNAAPTLVEEKEVAPAWGPEREKQRGRRMKAGAMAEWVQKEVEPDHYYPEYWGSDHSTAQPHNTPDDDYLQQHRENCRIEQEKNHMSQRSKGGTCIYTVKKNYCMHEVFVNVI